MNIKYNTGHPIDINELSEEERKIAFHEWAEGSPGLEKLLNEGYEKGFLSMACCAGHGENGKPYISYNLNDENSRKMAMSIAKELVNSDLDCKVSFNDDFFQTEEEYKEMRDHLIKTFPEEFSEETYSPTRTITQLDVRPKMENKEEVFVAMAKHIKEAELDKVNLPENQAEIPSKNFNENIKKDNSQSSMQQYEKKVEQSNNGKKMIDEVVEDSKKDMRQGEINNAISEIKQTEKSYMQEQTNQQQFVGNEPSIGG
jgi:hypothetical protein